MGINRKAVGSRGQAMMALVMVVGVVAMIFVASVVYKSTTAGKSSVQSSKSISAYELANAAVQKGIWALNLNSDNWNVVGSGGSIPGYDGSTVYTDIPGGKYKITITSGATADDRVIVAYAKDNSPTPQFRGLKVTLSKATAQFGAVMGYKIHFKKTTKVHWGPVYAYDSINLEGKSRLYYPQLYSMGKITNRDTNPALPNTDGLQWWSYNFAPGLPSWPNVDFEYYKALAKAQGTYYAKGDRGSHVKHADDKDGELDDNDKDDDDEYSYTNIIDTQPYVRFFDTGVKARFKGGNNLLRGVIIAMDNVEFKDGPASVAAVNAKYAASGLPNYYPRVETIPANAWKQYQKIDTSSAGDYPGDVGGPGASGQNATYTFGSNITNNTNTTAPIHFEGFLYSGAVIKLHRGGNVVGVVMSAKKTSEMGDSDEDDDHNDDSSYDNDHHDDDRGDDPSVHKDHGDDWKAEGMSRHLTVFYQDNLGIHIIGSGATQKAWQEVAAPAF